ncbi:T-complex 10 C-terminal domain-containing protein [Kitasatospora sp. NPDC086791]|uniref:T-complex 10 C-terminal domain-containing protein n=1 Tax=Kitasatospora sp. NPDC086791 TaxID=3155178 RepID=UPI00341B5CF8
MSILQAEAGLFAFALDQGHQGVTRRSSVEARAGHPSNTAERHADGSVTVTFPNGSREHYSPIGRTQAREIMAANEARTRAAEELGAELRVALNNAGPPLARRWSAQGSGVDVHVGGIFVSLSWWQATEALRAQAERSGVHPWHHVRDQVARAAHAVARKRGLTVRGEGTSLTITLP